jgi:hypothetical protein
VKPSSALRVFEDPSAVTVYGERQDALSIDFPPIKQTFLQSVFESDGALEARRVESFGNYADSIEAEANAEVRIYEIRIKADLARFRFNNRHRLFEEDDKQVTARLDDLDLARQRKFEQRAVEHANNLREYESISYDIERIRSAKRALLFPAPSTPESLPAPKATATAQPRATDAEKHAAMVQKRNFLTQQEKQELAAIADQGGNADDIRNTKLYFQKEREKLVG